MTLGLEHDKIADALRGKTPGKSNSFMIAFSDESFRVVKSIAGEHTIVWLNKRTGKETRETISLPITKYSGQPCIRVLTVEAPIFKFIPITPDNLIKTTIGVYFPQNPLGEQVAYETNPKNFIRLTTLPVYGMPGNILMNVYNFCMAGLERDDKIFIYSLLIFGSAISIIMLQRDILSLISVPILFLSTAILCLRHIFTNKNRVYSEAEAEKFIYQTMELVAKHTIIRNSPETLPRNNGRL